MPQTIPIVEKILSANDKLAQENLARLDTAGIFAINIMASPGAGKTSLIEQTVRALAGKYRVGMINGDIATSLDADRAAAAGAEAVQINTGGNCHLDAVQVQSALDQLNLANLDLLIVENIGNLICPAEFKLGTHKNVIIASIPEGDDKPHKYPSMYRGADVLILNKIDLLPYVPFRMDFFSQGVAALNPGVTQFNLSCTSGEGLEAWLGWLEAQIKK